MAITDMIQRAKSMDVKFNRKEIRVNKIKKDSGYQRPTDIRYSGRIARDHIPALMTEVIVSQRNGSHEFFILDGGHRADAALELGIKKLPALVLYGLSYNDEAELYTLLNTQRKTMSAVDKFIGQRESGDEGAVEVYKILSRYGLSVKRSGNTKASNVRCIAEIQFTYEHFGVGTLESIVKTITTAWGKRYPKRVDRSMFQGLRYLYSNKYYVSRINKTRLSKKLSTHDPAHLIREGKANAHHMSNAHHGKAIATRLVEVYNKGLSAKNKLLSPGEIFAEG